jgi:predicted RNA-binding Zn-ribbon protein involved in translation (DUF1610 family)
MNAVSPAPEEALEKNLCPSCGSALHLHICALCQTVTSCRYCNQPLHTNHRHVDYALPKIGPDRVAFRMARDRLYRRDKAANAAAQRSEGSFKNGLAAQRPNPTEPSRSAPASIEQGEMARLQPLAAGNDRGQDSNANAPGNIGMGLGREFDAGKPGTAGDLSAVGSKKWRAAVVLVMLASGAAAGYYAFTHVVQKSPVSAVNNTGIVTGTGAVPTAAREARGEITRNPQLTNSSALPQQNTMQEPGRPIAVKAAGSHSALPVQGKESEHAPSAAINHPPVAAVPVTAAASVAGAAPVPIPGTTERLPQTAAASEAAPKSSGSSDAVNSRTGGEGGVRDRAANATSTASRSSDRATSRCSTASQALGLCDARSR